MKQLSLPTLLLAGILLSVSFSCKEPGIPPAIEEEKEEIPADDDKFEIPEGPYEYDDALNHDTEAFLKAYKGKAYNGPHKVPGTLEAEDFDEGNANVAFYESDSKSGDAAYRGTHKVDVRGDGNASGGYMIGDVQPGEWMSYTIEVDEDGAYAIDTYVVKGDGSEGSFSFEVDGRGATVSVPMPLGNWSDFTKMATAENVMLTKGVHVLRYCGNTPGNVDRFVFRRTGELEDVSSTLAYPMTMKMSNPLFVDFPSPMYNSWLTGHLYTADASAHVWNIGGKEVLYVYASHDMEPSLGCDRMDRYHVFSTEDMVTWTDHGEIMNAATVRLQDGWGSEGFMWAPDCAYNPEDGLYYFYFPHPENTQNWNSTWRIGVAVSRYPDKEFHVAGYVKGMASAIDPCIFIDDDGQPYLYNGGGGKCYVAKLRKNDWTKLASDPVQMEGLHDFHEAAWVHKFGGRYYLSHSDNHSPSKGGNNMRYAVADNPAGPWQDMGVYMYPQGVETNHGSIVKFKGQWYAFYHTANFSGHGTLRSVCVDPVTVNSDGSIEIVRNWGKAKGGESPLLSADGLTFNATDFNDGGYHYAWFTRDRKEPTVQNGTVKGMETGDWLRWSFKAEASGTCTVTCSATSGAKVLVAVNGQYPETSGHDIPSSGTLKVEGLKVSEGENFVEFRLMSGTTDLKSVSITRN